jgi:hypothetical protein
MILTDVMNEIAERVGTVSPRSYEWPVGSVVAPAAVVGYPTSYTYDATYGRGMDTMELPVVLVAGRATDRAAREELSELLPQLKAAIEQGSHRAFDDVRVTTIDFDTYTLASIDYISAILNLYITGPGSKPS